MNTRRMVKHLRKAQRDIRGTSDYAEGRREGIEHAILLLQGHAGVVGRVNAIRAQTYKELLAERGYCYRATIERRIERIEAAQGG